MERSMRRIRLRAGERFIREGQAGSRFGYVERGIFRFYYLDEEGREATRAFVMEGGFLAARVSSLRGEPAPFTIEALEDSELLELEGEPVPPEGSAGAPWISFMNAIIQARLDHKDRRIKGFLTMDAAGRYLDFLDEFPGIEDRVRQHHIASYLGMTPVSLSRVRARLRREGRLRPSAHK